MSEARSEPLRRNAPKVLVTGGTRGIGAAITRRFLDGGFDVSVSARSRDSFDRLLAATTENLHARLDFLPVDFSVSDSRRDFLDRVQHLQRLDALVNNAGTNINNPITELRDEDLDYLDRVNLQAPIQLMRAAVEPMRRTGGGRIVNIASIWSIVTRRGRIAYSASKFGLLGATKAAAVDLADDNILVNAVSPGFTMTELTERTLSASDIASLESQVPLGRFANPDEIAGVVFFLCGEENSYVTGQNVAVDGGYTSV